MAQFYNQLQFLILDWEARMDCHGRIFYIDHKNHKTTWQKPCVELLDDSRRKNTRDEECQVHDQEYSTSSKRLTV